MKINNSPEQTLLKIERLKILNSNPELQAKRLEQLKIYTSSPEHKEHLRKLQEKRSFKVEILFYAAIHPLLFIFIFIKIKIKRGRS